jgi:hypothetical protein
VTFGCGGSADLAKGYHIFAAKAAYCRRDAALDGAKCVQAAERQRRDRITTQKMREVQSLSHFVLRLRRSKIICAYSAKVIDLNV